MNDARIAAELRSGAYDGMDDAATAAALRAKTVERQVPSSSLVTPDEFVDRFTAPEFAAAVDSSDPQVRKLVFRLQTGREAIDLASTTVQQGLAYMAAIGLLTAERAAAIGAIQAPATVTEPWERDYIDTEAIASIRLRMTLPTGQGGL